MQNLLSIRDASQRHMVVLLLDDRTVKQAAADVIFDVIGGADPKTLADSGTLAEGQLEDFQAIQNIIFDRDDQGIFIREDVNILANGKDLNPDEPLDRVMLKATKEGVEYKRCEVVVTGGGTTATVPPGTEQTSGRDSMKDLAYLMFLHQIATGAQIDVTKEFVELLDLIARAEREGLIEIDVKKAAYKLTEKGKRTHQSYLEEAQDLIKRYDIFADTDVDSSGDARFDTGLGRDLRIAIYEMEGINPYRARFLLGLNDGEWDGMENWMDVLDDEKWYRQVFQPIDTAPSVDDIGKPQLQSIFYQGKSRLRSANA
jgi:hypothetical protein